LGRSTKPKKRKKEIQNLIQWGISAFTSLHFWWNKFKMTNLLFASSRTRPDWEKGKEGERREREREGEEQEDGSK
jgi:hypothetical protein